MRFTGKWVEIEKIILCEVIQTPEKSMTHILFHMCFPAPNLPMWVHNIEKPTKYKGAIGGGFEGM